MERPEPRRPNAISWRSVPPRGTSLVWDGTLSPHNRYAHSAIPWTTDLASAPPRGVIDGIGPEEKVFWMFHAVGEVGAAFRARVWAVKEPVAVGAPWTGQLHFEARLILGGRLAPPGFGGFQPGTLSAYGGEIVNDQVPFPGATLIGGEDNRIEVWHEAGEWSMYIIEMGPDKPGSRDTHTYSAWWRAFWRPPPLTNAQLEQIHREGNEELGLGPDGNPDDAGEEWKRAGDDDTPDDQPRT